MTELKKCIECKEKREIGKRTKECLECLDWKMNSLRK